MNCRELQKLLPALAESEGSPRLALDSARHLARCRSCAASLLRMRELAGLLDRIPKVEVPPSFVRRVLRAVPKRRMGLGILALLAVLASSGALAPGPAPAALIRVLGGPLVAVLQLVARPSMLALELISQLPWSFDTIPAGRGAGWGLPAPGLQPLLLTSLAALGLVAAAVVALGRGARLFTAEGGFSRRAP